MMRVPASNGQAEAPEAAPAPMPATNTTRSHRLSASAGRPPEKPAAPAEPATTAPDETASASPSASKAEDYSIAISATRELKLPGPPGKLSIWIGLTNKAPAIGSEDVGASKPLREAGRTAKITPIALGMDTDPPTGCLKIDPDGSEKIFTLKPRSRGRFQVGASVELFNSDDCSGTPVPKSSDMITVEVEVGVASGLDELGAKAWQTFLDFWGQALALASALLLFLLRNKLSSWFGFSQPK